jgi:hypothetical protein
VLFAQLSVLKTRRRGVVKDEKMGDPFEVYAMAGAAIRDTEDRKIEFLAREALPQKSEEIHLAYPAC